MRGRGFTPGMPFFELDAVREVLAWVHLSFPFSPRCMISFLSFKAMPYELPGPDSKEERVPRENTRGCVIRGKRRKLASAFTLNGLSILHFLGCLNTSVWLMSILSIAIINEDTFL